jgi:hypothetical protein
MGTAGGHEQARPMRQRLTTWRQRAMARPRGEYGAVRLSPRARQIAGWLVALLLVIGVALVVRLVGGSGEGAPGAGAPSASAAAGDAAQIAFGTAIDDATGQVAADARTDRFAAGDTFAYSVEPGDEVPDPVYVAVERVGGGPAGVVQEAIDPQSLPDPRAVAFTVPTEDLLAVFGPGAYVMRIHADPDAEPIAEGEFVLVGSAASPTGSPAASP